MPVSGASRATINRKACPIRQAVGWLTPNASANRTDDMPLSDCNISHKALNQVLSASLVECKGVWVVAVN